MATRRPLRRPERAGAAAAATGGRYGAVLLALSRSSIKLAIQSAADRRSETHRPMAAGRDHRRLAPHHGHHHQPGLACGSCAFGWRVAACCWVPKSPPVASAQPLQAWYPHHAGHGSHPKAIPKPPHASARPPPVLFFYRLLLLLLIAAASRPSIFSSFLSRPNPLSVLLSPSVTPSPGLTLCCVQSLEQPFIDPRAQSPWPTWRRSSKKPRSSPCRSKPRPTNHQRRQSRMRPRPSLHCTQRRGSPSLPCASSTLPS